MAEGDPTLIIIVVLIFCIMIGGGLGVAYQKGYIGGDKEDEDDKNQACSEYTCPTGYSADPTATDTLCSSPTCSVTDRETCCNPVTVTCADFTCTSPGNFLNTIPGNITCAADPCTETECCSPANTSCTPDPCLNGGVCAATADGHTCTCAAGFSGDTCATASPPDNSPNLACSTYMCGPGFTADPTASATLCSSSTCGSADNETCCNPIPSCTLPADASKYDTSVGFAPADLYVNSPTFPTTVQCVTPRQHTRAESNAIIIESGRRGDTNVPDMTTTYVNACQENGQELTFQEGCGACQDGFHFTNEYETRCEENKCICPLGIGTTGTDCAAHDAISCASCTDIKGDTAQNCMSPGCIIPFGGGGADQLPHINLDWLTGGCLNPATTPEPEMCEDGWGHGDGAGNYCMVEKPCLGALVLGTDLYNKSILCVGTPGGPGSGNFDGCVCSCPYNYELSDSGVCSPTRCLGNLIEKLNDPDWTDITKALPGSIHCGEPPRDPYTHQERDMAYTGEGFGLNNGDICEYSCIPGYNPTYTGNTCTAGVLDGQDWFNGAAETKDPPCVQNVCGALAELPEGYVATNAIATTIPEFGTISCAAGWGQTDGVVPTATCHINNGNFNFTGCQENTCGALAELPEGYVAGTPTATTVSGLGAISCDNTTKISPFNVDRYRQTDTTTPTATCLGGGASFTFDGCQQNFTKHNNLNCVALRTSDVYQRGSYATALHACNTDDSCTGFTFATATIDSSIQNYLILDIPSYDAMLTPTAQYPYDESCTVR